MSGAVARSAAAGTASACAASGGTPRATSAADHTGATSSRAPVATHRHREAGRRGPGRVRRAPGRAPWRRAPAARPASVRSPARPARGHPWPPPAGRSATVAARTTNPISGEAGGDRRRPGPDPQSPAAGPAPPRRRSRSWRRRPPTRCGEPVVRKSASRDGSSCDTSPTTSPGSRPRGPSGRSSAARRSPARSRSAARCTRDGAPTSCGGPRAETVATVRSPASGGRSRPSTVRCWLGSSRLQPAAGARTSTRPDNRQLRSPARAALTRVASATRRCPAGSAGDRLRILGHDDPQPGVLPVAGEPDQR